MRSGYKRLLSIIMSFCIVFTAILPYSAEVDGAIPESRESDLNGHWAESVMTKWIDQGLLNGYGKGQYKPDNQVTRAEFAALINRIFGFVEAKALAFTDVPLTAWYADSVAKAYTAGVIQGVGNGKFQPEAYITRQDAAVMVARAFRIAEDRDGERQVSAFADANLISPYAVQAVNILHAKGYVQGNGKMKFAPTDYMTRAEVVKLVDNVMGTLVNTGGSFDNNVLGNLVVNSDKVALDGLVISGDLYIAPGVGEGTVTLDDVVVKGRTYVLGGGTNSIIVRNSSLEGTLIVDKWNGQIRVAASGSSRLPVTVLMSGAILEADNPTDGSSSFSQIEIRIPTGDKFRDVTLRGLFQDVRNSSNDVNLILDPNAVIQALTVEAALHVMGTGIVKLAKLNASGSTFDKRPNQAEFAKGITAIMERQPVSENFGAPSGNTPSGSSPSPSPEPSPSPSPEPETQLEIVDNGQTTASIWVHVDADEQTQDAAGKLAEYVEKSTGVALPIHTDDPALANNLPVGDQIQIYVGPEGLPSGNGQTDLLDGMDGDGFVIHQSGTRITIAGPTAWGTEFGVDEFLERYVGVRWLAPGEDWEDVPQLSQLTVPVNDEVRQEPAFLSREFDTHSSNTPERAAWTRNNRMHARVEFKHNLFNLFPPSQYKITNPEFYPAGAYLETHGGWQPCFTAPGIVEEAINNINAYFDANPEATSYSLGVNDGIVAGNSGYCEHSNEVNSIGYNNMSNIYYNWVNEVSKGVFAEHPDKFLGLLAYSEVYDPPTNGIKLDPRVIVYITDDRLSWGDPDLKTVGHNITEGWLEAADGVAFYEYLWGTPYMVPRTYFNLMEENYRYAKDAGVSVQYAEMVPNFGEGPKPWLSTKLQWNPDLDADALNAEWYERAVGSDAAADLAAYYEIWRAFWEEEMFETGWFRNWLDSEPRANYFNFLDDSYLDAVSPAIIKQSRDLLEAVVDKAVTEKQKKRAQALLKAFEYYEASALSHSLEKAVPQPANETEALQLVNSVLVKMRFAEKRRELVVSFKDDSFLQQAFSPYIVDEKTLGGYTRVWSGITKHEMDAIIAWLEQEDPEGAVHQLLENLADNDPVQSIRTHAYIMLRSSDPSSRMLLNANPSFEDAGTTADKADSWNLWLYNGAEMSRTNAVKKSGNYSIKAKGINFGGIIQTVQVQAGIHELSIGYFSPEGTTGKGTVRLQLDFWNAQNQHIGSIKPYLEDKRASNTAGEWATLYWAGEFPEGIVKVDAYVLFEGFGAAQEIYIDDFYLNRLSPDFYADKPKIPLNLNTSFELAGSTPQTSSDWTAWVYQDNGTIQRTSDDVGQTADYSVQAEGIGIIGGIYQSVKVESGVHGMSVAYYSPAGSAGNGSIRLQIEQYDAQNNHLGNLTPAGKIVSNTAGNWTTLEWIGEFPELVDHVNVNVLFEGFAPTQVAYIDDVQFYRLSPPIIPAEIQAATVSLNSSFETEGETPDKSASWTSWVYQDNGTLQRTGDNWHNVGDYSMKAKGIGIVGGIYQSVPVAAGAYGMRVSYYSPLTSAGNGTIRLQFEQYDANNVHLGNLTPAGKPVSASAGSLATIDWNGEFAPGTAHVNVNVLFEGFGADQEVYFDDAHFYQIQQVVPVEYVKTHLSLNPSVETPGDSPALSESWTSWVYQDNGTLIRTDEEVGQSGDYSMKGEGIGIIGGIYQSVQVEPGEHGMKVSYYAPAGSTGNGIIRLQFEQYDANNVHLGNLTPTGKKISTLAGNWLTIEWSGQFVEGTSKVNVNVLLEGMAAGQQVYFDDADFYRLDPVE